MQSRAKHCKKNEISPQVELVKKSRRSNGFKVKRAYSEKPNPKEKQVLTKVNSSKKRTTKSHTSKVSREIVSAHSDIDSSK